MTKKLEAVNGPEIVPRDEQMTEARVSRKRPSSEVDKASPGPKKPRTKSIPRKPIRQVSEFDEDELEILKKFRDELLLNVHESWKDALSADLDSNSFFTTIQQVMLAVEKNKCYPPKELIFRALWEPLTSVKAVILGQDPYHGPNQATGLAFSVPTAEKVPPSLMNVYKELKIKSLSGDLTSWCKQGVLLLNTVLTVEPGRANSHAKFGWQEFTDSILRVINEKCEHVVFLFWGQQAQSKDAGIDEGKHCILRASHPSPLSCKNFLGCGHFESCNAFLREHNLGEIDWTTVVPSADEGVKSSEDTLGEEDDSSTTVASSSSMDEVHTNAAVASVESESHASAETEATPKGEPEEKSHETENQEQDPQVPEANTNEEVESLKTEESVKQEEQVDSIVDESSAPLPTLPESDHQSTSPAPVEVKPQEESLSPVPAEEKSELCEI